MFGYAFRKIAWMSMFVVGPLVNQVSAQECPSIELEEEVGRSDAIFEGHVLRVEPVDAGLRVTFDVVQTWKGADQEEIEVLVSSLDGETAALRFEVDHSYLIFARRGQEGTLVIDSCSHTKPIDDAGEELTLFGAGVTPVAIDDEMARPDTDTETDVIPPIDASRAGCRSCALASLNGVTIPWWGAVGVLLVLRRRGSR